MYAWNKQRTFNLTVFVFFSSFFTETQPRYKNARFWRPLCSCLYHKFFIGCTRKYLNALGATQNQYRSAFNLSNNHTCSRIISLAFLPCTENIICSRRCDEYSSRKENKEGKWMDKISVIYDRDKMIWINKNKDVLHSDFGYEGTYSISCI